ncbi:DUF2637 domain-containing protein [Pseudonocardia sp. ICBG601]|uniref:DUF2637 domain-containing protein n=1 Tax=Pseudonocardia sp. ICBG601 TaxID=2846759 RepID=UPI0027E2F5FF|nr:DUF2637 domain-containing protein [Pseudonocardia sp. ICBG601]
MWPTGLLSVSRAVLLSVVVLAPEAAAWQGLVGFARGPLGLSGGWEFLVPLLFGAAAFYVALLAQRFVLRGDSAVVERGLTWLYASAGAGFNFWFAASSGRGFASAVFFGGASLSAVLLWDRTLRAWRRDQLRGAGLLERPLPRFRVLRWVLAPATTFRAFRVAVLNGVSSPGEALAVSLSAGASSVSGSSVSEAVRGGMSESPAGQELRSYGSAEVRPTVATEGRLSLVEIEKSSGLAPAVREAWRMLGVGPGQAPTLRDVDRVIEFLDEHGIRLDRKYGRELRLRALKELRRSGPVSLVPAVNS